MYFYTGQTEQKVVTQTPRWEGVPTIIDQSPLSKFKTDMQVPPSGRSFTKTAEKKQVSHSPLYP